MKKYHFIIFLIINICICLPISLQASEHNELSNGQTIYVPAYSHIYSGNTERPFLLAVTISIRNIDPAYPITIIWVDYHATQGSRLKRYITQPVILNPLETLRFVVPESDKSGGSGANFIVEWKSDKPVNPPIVESIMIGTQVQQGVSFTSRGKAIIPSK